MGLVALRQGNGHPQGNQPELAGLQLDILSCPEVNPIGFPVHIAQGFQIVQPIFYLNFNHVNLQKTGCFQFLPKNNTNRAAGTSLHAPLIEPSGKNLRRGSSRSIGPENLHARLRALRREAEPGKGETKPLPGLPVRQP